MANRNNKGVIIKVDNSFFNNIFEPERRKLQAKFGKLNLSQSDFTAFLAKAGAKWNYKLKIDNRFSPRRGKNGGLNLDL